MNGLVYCSGAISTINGPSSITFSSAPWFDPRGGGGGGGGGSTTTFSSVAGPQP